MMDIIKMTRRKFLSNSGFGIAGFGVLSLCENISSSDASKTGYIYDDRYLNHVLSSGHPESPERLITLNKKLNESGLINHLVRMSPFSEDSIPYIKMIHTEQHIQSVSTIQTTGEISKLAVTGALTAVKAVHEGRVRNAFCALRPPGHHAHNNGGEEGFCFYNNVAIAAKYAQSLGNKKILIIDWDFHHGNGTQDSFYEDPSVLFFSTHNWNAYPGTGDPAKEGSGAGLGYTVNVHLASGSTDQDMLKAWNEKLTPKVEWFKPDFILISAGFDSRKDDTLGNFAISDDCFIRITKMAMQFAEKYSQGRLVSLLEGGYNVQGLSEAAYCHISQLASIPISSIQTAQSYRKVPTIKVLNQILVAEAYQGKRLTIALYTLKGTFLREIGPFSQAQVHLPLSRLGLSDGMYIAKACSNGNYSEAIIITVT